MTQSVPTSASEAGGGPGGWATNRLPYLDKLKILMIAAIIAIHGVLGYAESMGGAWSYGNVAEAHLDPVTETLLLVLAGPFALLMIPLFFLVAGLLTPGSVARKGPGRFARDRLLRLGVPLAIFVLVLWPALLYALYYPLGHAKGSYWAEFLGPDRAPDTGPLWFVAVLLIFSLAYAGWVRLRRDRPATTRREVTAGGLAVIVAVVTAATFAIRLVYPFASESFGDLNLWQWPAAIALFGLGVAGSRWGWLSGVPDRLRRQCAAVTVAGLVAGGALAASAGPLGVRLSDLAGGWGWPALAFAAIENTLAGYGAIWLLAVAQRRLGRPLGARHGMGPVLARCAYGAFLVQGPVLIGLAVALRPVPVPGDVKALVVAAGGVAGSFALAWLLIRRLPGAARVL